MLGEFAQILGPGIVLGGIEDQQPTIELDYPLPKRRRCGCRRLGPQGADSKRWLPMTVWRKAYACIIGTGA